MRLTREEYKALPKKEKHRKGDGSVYDNLRMIEKLPRWQKYYIVDERELGICFAIGIKWRHNFKYHYTNSYEQF